MDCSFTISDVYGEDEDKLELKNNDSYLMSLFRIDADNGEVFVKSELDRETVEVVRLTIHVEDLNAWHPSPQTATGNYAPFILRRCNLFLCDALL